MRISCLPKYLLMGFISYLSQLVSFLLLATDCFTVKASFLLCLLLGIARKRKETSMHVTSNISQITSGMPMPNKEWSSLCGKERAPCVKVFISKVVFNRCFLRVSMCDDLSSLLLSIQACWLKADPTSTNTLSGSPRNDTSIFCCCAKRNPASLVLHPFSKR